MELSADGKKFLIKTVADFSFDVVAAKTKFKENNGAEIIVLTLLYTIHAGDDLKLSLDLLNIVSRELLQYKEI